MWGRLSTYLLMAKAIQRAKQRFTERFTAPNCNMHSGPGTGEGQAHLGLHCEQGTSGTGLGGEARDDDTSDMVTDPRVMSRGVQGRVSMNAAESNTAASAPLRADPDAPATVQKPRLCNRRYDPFSRLTLYDCSLRRSAGQPGD